MHLFGVRNLRSIHSTPLDPKWCLRVFRIISLTFSITKDLILVFRDWMHYVGYRSCENGVVTKASILLQWSQNHWECFGAFRKPSEWKRCKAPKFMIGTFLEHFTYLQNVKRCEICVLGINALFRGIEVAMRSLYSIRPKMMFGCVLDHFANLRI
jgi:hypothetical protein